MADRVLRLVPNIDVRAFKLDPTDGYVLSRVDGRLGARDLAAEMGLPEGVVAASLEKLEAMGIAEAIDGSSRRRAQVPAEPPPPSAPAAHIPRHVTHPGRAPATSPLPVASVFSRATVRPAAPFGAPTPIPDAMRTPPPGAVPTAPPVDLGPARSTAPPDDGAPDSSTTDVSLGDPKYDRRELDEPVDLTREQKRTILDLYYRLGDLDHFTALGVTRDADKKAIKRAYFELAALLHPDRHFKKDLGTYKTKMEAVFARVTEAHDTLTDRVRRASYEAELAESPTTQGMEALLERAMRDAKRSSSIPPPAPAPSIPAPSASSTPPYISERPRSPIPSAIPSRWPDGPPPTPEDQAARRQALARKLLGARHGTVPPAEATRAPRTSGPTTDAVEALRRRYVERAEGVASAQAKAHMDRAERALEQGDLGTASASFRAAAELAPDDAESLARHQELRREAEEAVLSHAMKQAEDAEKAGHALQAARAWEKVAKLRVNDPYAHDKVARLYLKAENVSLHEAAEHAKRAVQLLPAKVQFHVTLAEVYLRAGLKTSARKAAGTGLAMAPDSEELRALLKKAEKP